uniref:Metallothionein 1b n=1 Tax=Amanita strobiliformis TaxID=67730 RepID=E7DZK3_9AGAR|nr:metallothionein 1b [Amanita strobiliformis]AFU72280.1 metallothionein 1b [Amanita strobiliformis]
MHSNVTVPVSNASCSCCNNGGACKCGDSCGCDTH